jgi:hypothetical protein
MMDNGFVFTHPNIPVEQLTVYDARKEPFQIYGLYQPKEPGVFKRMPIAVAENVSKRVRLLHTNTAGARLRFVTDSPFIAVGAIYPPMEFPSARTAAFAAAGAFSFDLYADNQYCRILWPMELVQRGSVVSFDIPKGQYESFCELGEKKRRQITLNFPSFVNIQDIYIGLQEGAVLEAAPGYVNQKPVVFYGSSITQGACASHPGNIYQNILSRKLNFDYLNLGFASGAKAEDAIIDYLCTLDMCMLVFDYDHNAKDVEYLEKTHLPALRKLRAAHPDIPFIVLSRPNRDPTEEKAQERAKLIAENCRILSEEGNAPVHFINGQTIFHSHDSEMMTIDGTHPTDLGFYCIAKALYDPISQYL